jgi:hypothetical protein
LAQIIFGKGDSDLFKSNATPLPKLHKGRNILKIFSRTTGPEKLELDIS